jgi:AcrR family transcriptional regulator
MAESWEETRGAHRGRQAAAISAGALSLLTEHGASALTMAAIADAAEVSRQTLYRYYGDVDAVLVGIAELVTSHDEAFAQIISEQPDPRSQLELIAITATGDGHGDQNAAALLAVLPPAGREVIAQHHACACDLLSDVLWSGIDDGSFREDLRPPTDAPLLLGLFAAADPSESERAISLIHQLVESQPKEHRK